MEKHDFQIRNEEIEADLTEIGDMLCAKMPKGWGFSVLITSFGEGGAVFYVSNVEREDMIEVMREFIKKHEKIQ